MTDWEKMGQWRCPDCETLNAASDEYCTICGLKRPVKSTSSSRPTTSGDSGCTSRPTASGGTGYTSRPTASGSSGSAARTTTSGSSSSAARPVVPKGTGYTARTTTYGDSAAGKTPGVSGAAAAGATVISSSPPTPPKKQSGSSGWWGVAAVVVVLILLPRLFSSSEPSSTSWYSPGSSTGSYSATAAPAWQTLVSQADGYMSRGDYYQAALIYQDCYNTYPDARSTCSRQLDAIRSQLRSIEPSTGELARTIQYQGRHEIHITASSGPVEATFTDVEDPGQYVRFYVRQGETSLIYLVNGTYRVSYKVGLCWFNDSIGFGDLCTYTTLSDTLTFNMTNDGSWVTYQYWDYTA